jgi:hypothetical protein
LKVYIAGPMSGLPEHNYPAFARAAALLRTAGYAVTSPHELNPSDRPWQDCMRVDLKAMLDGCEAIVMLPGWVGSRGAGIELRVARAVGMDVLYWPLEGLLEADITPAESAG